MISRKRSKIFFKRTACATFIIEKTRKKKDLKYVQLFNQSGHMITNTDHMMTSINHVISGSMLHTVMCLKMDKCVQHTGDFNR